MLTSMRLKNFKCWQDTREVEFGRITLLFGANSSGKSSIMQSLLLLQQSANSRDRKQILNFGNEGDPVRLGSFSNIILDGDEDNSIEFNLSWKPVIPFQFSLVDESFKIEELHFENSIGMERHPPHDGKSYTNLKVKHFTYTLNIPDSTNPIKLGMKQLDRGYSVIDKNYGLVRVLPESKVTDSEPDYFFGFHEKLRTQYQNTNTLFDLVWEQDSQLYKIQYLGPLRSRPERFYSYYPGQGDSTDVGYSGEIAIHALLTDRYRHKRGEVYGTSETAEMKVAKWLQEMGLIDSFEIKEEAENLYTVLIQTPGNKHKSNLVDVGFGISQVLPALVLCAVAPGGSTIFLEQPEMHLHPKAQTALADVFVDVISEKRYKDEYRYLQIVIESQSEHLLTRLQRRMAEGKDEEKGISSSDVRTYFCTKKDTVASLEKLDLDEYGYITNWPEDFFGDELEERSEMLEAMIKRHPTNAAL